MPLLRKAPPGSHFNSPAKHSVSDAQPIRLYGWDSRSETWHGPNELSSHSVADRRLLQALQAVTGKSWYGPITCGATRRGMAARFFALVHDLSDCGVGAIYCDESKAGPAEIVAVIPACRRSKLRDEFTFEFLAFARFLGSLSAGAELQVHEAITSALATGTDSETMVFSISSGLWPVDLDPVLSSCVEKLALTLCRWLEGTSASGLLAGHRSSSAA